MKLIYSLIAVPALALSALIGNAQASMPTITAETFADTDGHHINVHGGGIIEHNGTYYWYGEHRGDGTPGSGQLGVGMYSSADLKNWTNRGIVLPVTDNPDDLLQRGCTIERPKVIYNPATGQFVMWFHHELKGMGYAAAFAGVAVSDKPEGPFKYLGSSRVNPGHYPLGTTDEQKKAKFDPKLEWWTPEWREAVNQGLFVNRDLLGGQMARDMQLFVDDDGKAYHIYSSEENLTLNIAELDSTFTRHTGRYVRVAPGGHNEAPALFKHDGTYWMITSGCTGWAPNEARLMRADNIMGPWTQLPNPCRGEGAGTTFDSQSTYVLRVGDNYTFMADRWRPKQLGLSPHLWLPIQFDENGVPFITNSEQ